MAGGSPGSNAHRWGTRFYELRRVPAGASGSALELRLHDAVRFQGAGMRPDQMPPTSHACSPWEPLPAEIRVSPATTSCADDKAACAAIDQYLRSTARAVAPDPSGFAMPDESFGRGLGGCE